jgi:hypothetical protein
MQRTWRELVPAIPERHFPLEQQIGQDICIMEFTPARDNGSGGDPLSSASLAPDELV